MEKFCILQLIAYADVFVRNLDRVTYNDYRFINFCFTKINACQPLYCPF